MSGRRSSESSIKTDSHQQQVPPPPCSNPFSSRKSAEWSNDGTTKSNFDFGQAICGSRRPQTELTIVIMGSTKVGKSAIVNQFLHGVFQEDYKETVDDMHWIEYDAMSTSPQSASSSTTPKSETRKNQSRQNSIASNVGIFLLKIIDASGSREFLAMRKLYEQQGDAFILVIAIDDQQSFEEAKVIRREIDEQNRKHAPVIVVLNKIDLRDEKEENANKKIHVSDETTREFALSSNSLFLEATATKYESVNEIFQRLLQHHASIPSVADLKYRRKSMPICVNANDLSSLTGSNKFDRRSTAVSSRRLKFSTFVDQKSSIEEIAEEENEPTINEKRSSCVLS